MRTQLLCLFDRFIPESLHDSLNSEERDRARALICVVLFVLMFIAAVLAGYHLSPPMRSMYTEAVVAVLSMAILIFALILGLFKSTGNFVLCGNLFFGTVYLVTLVTAFERPEAQYIPTLALILASPVLAAQIASYGSGIAWTLIIALTPFGIMLAGGPGMDSVWLSAWLVILGGLFFATYIGHYYRENLALRLRAERAHFEFAATHDALTGLANRITFDNRLARCLQLCRAEGDSAVLVYLDLDRFKPVNDTYGHHAGDQVLVVVSRRLDTLVRRADTVARLGGDEFAVLFEHCTLDDIVPLIRRIDTEVRRPIALGSQEISITCSMGVVTCPEDGVEPEALYLTADRRMYAAKERGAFASRA